MRDHSKTMKFAKELYSKTALIKAAYNYTDRAYVHLDCDDRYYYVDIVSKAGCDEVLEEDFINEMLAQSVRHEVYLQTKNIRELLMARAFATSLVTDKEVVTEDNRPEQKYSEDEILKDWFGDNDETG